MVTRGGGRIQYKTIIWVVCLQYSGAKPAHEDSDVVELEKSQPNDLNKLFIKGKKGVRNSA
jgi:hypothetical protein